MTSGLLSLGCILYADGAANAASGPAQYPTLLSGYVKRAPFNVSGVDYRAGYSSSQTLTDWQSISQTGVTVNTGTNTVTVTGSNVTLSGIDFSLHGGAYVVISGATSTTITNSNFAYTGTAPTTPPITIGSSAINTTISYCVIDGNGVNSDPTPAGIFRINAATNVTIKYCYVKNASEDFVDIGDSAGPSGTLTVMYNLWESNGMGTYSPNHPDFLQILATNLSFHHLQL